MQMTIRNIPKAVRARLEVEAKAESISLNQAALNALRKGLGLSTNGKFKRDLSFFNMTKEDADIILKSVARSDAGDIAAQKRELRRENRARHKSIRRSRKGAA